ncbi:alpha/beta fold hydrolase [Vibrio quintilis]|uniref:alpha/beta fold hydrolase n=1 Tax=Vibrio quintilis TaxID=1117707 RepID=UPI0009F851FF
MTQKTYHISGNQLAALESGTPSATGISVVFLHGWLDNAASFSPVLARLEMDTPGVHFCALDLPGHGLSGHKSTGNYYTFHDYIDDVHQVLTDIPAKTVILAGHSLGGLIASCYSAAFPERVSDIILIEALGPLAESPQDCVRRLRNGVLSRERIRRKVAKKGFRSLQQALSLRANRSGVAEKCIRPLVERGLEMRDDRWFWRADPMLSADSLYRMAESHATAILKAIQCPVTLIRGTQGYEYLMQPERLSLMENITVHTLPGGHHCHLEQPDQVAQMIDGVVRKRQKLSGLY